MMFRVWFENKMKRQEFLSTVSGSAEEALCKVRSLYPTAHTVEQFNPDKLEWVEVLTI